jgi:hypothetical protein
MLNHKLTTLCNVSFKPRLRRVLFSGIKQCTVHWKATYVSKNVTLPRSALNKTSKKPACSRQQAEQLRLWLEWRGVRFLCITWKRMNINCLHWHLGPWGIKRRKGAGVCIAYPSSSAYITCQQIRCLPHGSMCHMSNIRGRFILLSGTAEMVW